MALFPPIDADVDAVREALRPLRNDFTVALHAAANAFAVGAIVRVAHSFLAREIVLIGDAPYFEKASMGMEKYETIVRVPTDEAFLEHVGDRPLWAVEKDAATTSVTAVERFPKDVVLLFGSERFGIPRGLLERASVTVGVPIYGVNHSLPLAVAAGIVMNEWARRRYATGTVL
ncbi:MAG: TrmH family RNA methyltransferase [Labilithrix sp.]|nr:TrmH family RNA methyltransferase [Labilithrix sp.]MCW5834313.1 TrmH family RNA methyltransferase [Labilithrix sp.]